MDERTKVSWLEVLGCGVGVADVEKAESDVDDGHPGQFPLVCCFHSLRMAASGLSEWSLPS